MRPRKHVVLYGGSDLMQSILRVVLGLHYRVQMEMAYPAPDAFLLIDFSGAELAAFEAQRWQACWQVGVVSVSEADIIAVGGMAALLYKLKLATFRKRGPVPGSRRHVQSRPRKVLEAA